MSAMLCKVEGCNWYKQLTGWCLYHYNLIHKYNHECEETVTYPSMGVSEETVDTYKKVAGEGELDQRCSNILQHLIEEGVIYEPAHWTDDTN